MRTQMQVLELQDIGSRQPSMESLTGPTDTSHLHPGQQFSGRRSPSLRYSLILHFFFQRKDQIFLKTLSNYEKKTNECNDII